LQHVSCDFVKHIVPLYWAVSVDCCCFCTFLEAVVMRGSAQQYPMIPAAAAQPGHSFPVVLPAAGTVPHQRMMHIPPAGVALPANVHPQYAFQQPVYGMPLVRGCTDQSILCLCMILDSLLVY